MDLKRSPFDPSAVEVVQRETVFSGFFKLLKLQLRHRLFGGGWSPLIERELFYKSAAAAAVIYDPVNDLIGLVEQFRVGMLDSESGAWSLEGVAGMVEVGESPEALIRRELREEAGIDPVALRYIAGFYATPGSCNEYTHLYCAVCDLSGGGGLFGLEDEGEDIRFNVFPALQVFDAMLQSRANNGATLIGLQWLQLHRQSLRTQHSSWR